MKKLLVRRDVLKRVSAEQLRKVAGGGSAPGQVPENLILSCCRQTQ